MSTPAPQPQSARRNNRSRKTPMSGMTQGSGDGSQSEAPITTPHKQRRKRGNQRNHQAAQVQQPEEPVPTQNPVSPLTPPRTDIQKDINPDVYISPVAPGTHTNSNGRNKKRGGNNAGNRETNTTPKPHKSRSPQPPSHEQVSSPTPAKVAQIYAGPTFHASPAASALPIPKFFSKSMPQVNNKDASLSAMMQDDVSEESTSQGDESPTLRNAARLEIQNNREESPLDIFFKADRAEKARQQFGSPLNNSISTPNEKFRASSASPAHLTPRHHSRQPTDSAIFPLEMEGESRKSGSIHTSPNTPVASIENRHVAPSPGKTDVAKTEALKQLLFARSQTSDSPGTHSPSPSPTPPRVGQPYAASPNPRSQSSSPYSSIYGGDLSASRPLPNRNHSSQLRQEVSIDQVSELPTTPTPSRSKDIFKRTNSDGPSSRVHSQRPESAQAPRFEAHDALRATFGTNETRTTSNEAIEDTLRQILKLDLLPSTGVR